MKKLLELQQKLKPIVKDTVNPFYKSYYADVNGILEVIKPVLNEVGVVILQPLSHINGDPAIRTMIIDGETNLVIYEDITPVPNLSDPQKMGSCYTYWRRYALQSLLLLEAEDDDANKTIQRPEKPFLQNYNGGKSVAKGGVIGSEVDFNPAGELKTIKVEEM